MNTVKSELRPYTTASIKKYFVEHNKNNFPVGLYEGFMELIQRIESRDRKIKRLEKLLKIAEGK